jgi:hypothetical protein
VAPDSRIFDHISSSPGTFINTVALPEWLGAKGDDRTYDAAADAAAVSAFENILFSWSRSFSG